MWRYAVSSEISQNWTSLWYRMYMGMLITFLIFYSRRCINHLRTRYIFCTKLMQSNSKQQDVREREGSQRRVPTVCLREMVVSTTNSKRQISSVSLRLHWFYLTTGSSSANILNCVTRCWLLRIWIHKVNCRFSNKFVTLSLSCRLSCVLGYIPSSNHCYFSCMSWVKRLRCNYCICNHVLSLISWCDVVVELYPACGTLFLPCGC